MARVLEVIDNTGRKIYLTEERFNHIKKHPEMQSSISIIEETIKNPQKITAVSFDNSINYFYKHHKNHKSKAKYLRVVVRYTNGEGFIITAYFVEEIR